MTSGGERAGRLEIKTFGRKWVLRAQLKETLAGISGFDPEGKTVERRWIEESKKDVVKSKMRIDRIIKEGCSEKQKEDEY